MKRVLILLLSVGCLADAQAADGLPIREIRRTTEGGVELVQVPPGTVERPVADPTVVPAKDGVAYSSRSELVITPGVNEIIPIAAGHLNRIVTPFASPNIRTADDSLKAVVDGRVVYLSSDQPKRAALFIEPAGVQSIAISLTIVPRDIPPREIILKLPNGAVIGAPVKDRDSDSGEAAGGYVDDITTTFRALALGQVPQGYTYRPIQSGDPAPSCLGSSGVTFDFRGGQLLAGTVHDVLVGLAVSSGSKPVELREQWCVTTGVAAVAYWPRSVLQPGERTEVYVMRRVSSQQPAGRGERPSLVGDR